MAPRRGRRVPTARRGRPRGRGALAPAAAPRRLKAAADREGPAAVRRPPARRAPGPHRRALVATPGPARATARPRDGGGLALRTSPQDAAVARGLDELLGVHLEEEPLLDEALRRLLDRLDESVVVLVPLLERLARVAAGEPVRLRGREREERPAEAAEIRRPEARADVPAHVRSERHAREHRLD